MSNHIFHRYFKIAGCLPVGKGAVQVHDEAMRLRQETVKPYKELPSIESRKKLRLASEILIEEKGGGPAIKYCRNFLIGVKISIT
jgi:hypothetical protein